MLSGRQSFRFVRPGWLVALLQSEINLVRHWSAVVATRSTLLSLQHDDDDVAWVFVRREGSKPDGMSDHFPARHPLGGPRFGANPQSRHGGFLAGAFRVFHVGEHGLTDDIQAAFADVQVAADPTG